MELQKDYVLTNESVDEISEKVTEFLTELKTERRNLLQIRLVLEDLLLDWQDHFSAETSITVKMGKRLGRPYIQLELAGEAYNSLTKEAEDFGVYRNRIMSNMGLSPLYTYTQGKNRLLFKLKKPAAHPLVTLAAAIAAGLVIGGAGLWLPDALRAGILDHFLTPVYDTFFNVLGAIAGPLVFLSIAWGIYGIGDTATFGRIGKRMILHFLGMVYLLCTAATLLSIPFFDLEMAGHAGSASQLDSLFRLLLDFFPSDIVTPFQEGNSLQIIFLGSALGVALLVLGTQTDLVAQVIEQINLILQFLMELVSKLVPWFIFIVLVQLVWSGTLSVVLAAWKPLVVLIILSAVMAAGMVLLASLQTKTSPILLLKKSLPTLLIAASTASSVASFGSCVNVCEKKLGISNNITSFGVPLGIVAFPPASALCFILICIHSAEVYQVECSVTWFILAVFAGVILAIASPPIPGGTLTCYTILFMQLGLPEEGLVAALALDVLCDFIATGINMFCLQMELLIQAKTTGTFNAKVLQRKS